MYFHSNQGMTKEESNGPVPAPTTYDVSYQSFKVNCEEYIYINIPGFLKNGLAKISTHFTTWQFKTTKLIQRPILKKPLYDARTVS